MVEFNSGYFHPMDREYETIDLDNQSRPLYDMNISDIGISTPPFKDQLDSIQARIKQGASTIELGFSGAGKGSMGGGNTTPGMVPKWQRQAIKDLAKINKLKLSTHATFATGSLAGFAQNRFDEQMREKAIHEINRAIDFAADTTEGGAIVAHLGEFPRSIYESYGDEKFKGYEEEEKHAAVYLVDKRTGEIVTGLQRSTRIPVPVYEEDPEGRPMLDEHGEPIPKFNSDSGMFETQIWGWDDFNRETERWNREHPDHPKSVAKMFFEKHMDLQIKQAKGMAKYWAQGYDENVDTLRKYKEIRKDYEETFKHVTPEDRMKWGKLAGGDRYGLIPPEVKDPIAFIDDAIKQTTHQLEHMRETALSYAQQVKQSEERLQNTTSMEQYGLNKTADTLARAAETAMLKSKKTKDPLFVAPENVFAEQYGSHPQELKKIVQTSRERFVERMTQKGMSEGRAKKLASQHIRATFDIGHANTWKKYYQGDPKKSYEANEKDFKKWIIDQVKDLNKNDIIGHVHVSDNFGYEDEHVTPGQGNAPIKEFLTEMKKAGIKRVIVEPGHQDYQAQLGAFREFGGSIYGGNFVNQTWSDVGLSYFGKTKSPYFIFGEYAPSQDFQMWTQTPLE